MMYHSSFVSVHIICLRVKNAMSLANTPRHRWNRYQNRQPRKFLLSAIETGYVLHLKNQQLCKKQIKSLVWSIKPDYSCDLIGFVSAQVDLSVKQLDQHIGKNEHRQASERFALEITEKKLVSTSP